MKLFNKYTKEFVYSFLIIYFLIIYVNIQKNVTQICVYKGRPKAIGLNRLVNFESQQKPSSIVCWLQHDCISRLAS